MNNFLLNHKNPGYITVNKWTNIFMLLTVKIWHPPYHILVNDKTIFYLRLNISLSFHYMCQVKAASLWVRISNISIPGKACKTQVYLRYKGTGTGFFRSQKWRCSDTDYEHTFIHWQSFLSIKINLQMQHFIQSSIAWIFRFQACVNPEMGKKNNVCCNFIIATVTVHTFGTTSENPILTSNFIKKMLVFGCSWGNGNVKV